MLHVTLDATYALDSQPTGVARYSARMIEWLGARRDLDLTLAARPRNYRQLRAHYPHFKRVVMQEPFNLLWPRRTDVFHGLNQRLPNYRFKRAITTIHDVFPLSS